MKLTLNKKSIFPVYENKNGKEFVNARSVHDFIGSNKDFTSWMKQQIKRFEMRENVDYILNITKTGKRQNVIKHEYYIAKSIAKIIYELRYYQKRYTFAKKHKKRHIYQLNFDL